MIIAQFIAVLVLSYLLGAIPWGLIIGKLMAGVDVREYGSGNIGGTNVMRTLGKKIGAISMALDVGKAALAVILARVIIGDTSVALLGGFPLHWQMAQLMAAIMVMVGHNWSIFLKFHGGRGVASYFGSLLPIAPVAAIFGGQVLLATIISTRYMSLGSIVSVVAVWCLFVPLTLLNGFSPLLLVYGLLSSILIIHRHRENISRLQAGTELKLGEKVQALN